MSMGVAAGQDPLQPPPPPVTDPKTVARNKGFCGRCRRRDFVLVLRQRVNFCFTACVYTQNAQIFQAISNMPKTC